MTLQEHFDLILQLMLRTFVVWAGLSVNPCVFQGTTIVPLQGVPFRVFKFQPSTVNAGLQNWYLRCSSRTARVGMVGPTQSLRCSVEMAQKIRGLESEKKRKATTYISMDIHLIRKRGQMCLLMAKSYIK